MKNINHVHEFIMGPRKKAAVCRCGAFQHGPNNTNEPIVAIERDANEVKHTPTPWYFDFEKSYGANHGREWEISSKPASSGVWTAHCQSGHDAAYIVLAVNAHEELLKAAKLALLELEMIDKSNQESNAMYDLKVAIAKAEGK